MKFKTLFYATLVYFSISGFCCAKDFDCPYPSIRIEFENFSQADLQNAIIVKYEKGNLSFSVDTIFLRENGYANGNNFVYKFSSYRSLDEFYNFDYKILNDNPKFEHILEAIKVEPYYVKATRCHDGCDTNTLKGFKFDGIEKTEQDSNIEISK